MWSVVRSRAAALAALTDSRSRARAPCSPLRGPGRGGGAGATRACRGVVGRAATVRDVRAPPPATPRTTIFFLRPLAPALHILWTPRPAGTCRPAPPRACSLPAERPGTESRVLLIWQRLGDTLQGWT